MTATYHEVPAAALKAALLFAAKDMTRYDLTSVAIYGDRVVATDGRHLACITTHSTDPDWPLTLVPTAAVRLATRAKVDRIGVRAESLESLDANGQLIGTTPYEKGDPQMWPDDAAVTKDDGTTSGPARFNPTFVEHVAKAAIILGKTERTPCVHLDPRGGPNAARFTCASQSGDMLAIVMPLTS
jgi:hypothetical protein